MPQSKCQAVLIVRQPQLSLCVSPNGAESDPAYFLSYKTMPPHHHGTMLFVLPLQANDPKEELFRPSSHVSICKEDTIGTPLA